jgi:hypothetical protein
MDVDNIESLEGLPNAPKPLPLQVDLRYNVAVCTDCCTGVAFDWIRSHLRSIHGIRVQLDAVMVHLNIDAPTLSSTEIETWISDDWVLDRAIEGVPFEKGMACTLCHYSGAEKQTMKDHFVANHEGLKWRENIKRCNVQMPFQGRLKKYFIIEDAEEREVEMGAQNDWKMELDQDFQEAMGEAPDTAPKGRSDLRLSSAFIARMRWDLRVKDMDLCELQKAASMPTKSDRLFQVILCGRKYIEMVCSDLNEGNMMLKRRLMSAG